MLFFSNKTKVYSFGLFIDLKTEDPKIYWKRALKYPEHRKTYFENVLMQIYSI